MTAKQAQTIEQALARAAKENIHIVGKGTMKADGARFWIVSSKNYATTGVAYIVTIKADHLHCNCPAPDICKHRAVVHQALKDERDAVKTCSQCGAEVAYCATCDAEHAIFDEPQRDALAAIEQQEAPALSSCSNVEEQISQHNQWADDAPGEMQQWEEVPAEEIAEIERRVDAFIAIAEHAHEYGEHPALPEGWEINEEGAGWVAREHGRAILTPRGRNIKRFSSWFAAQHGIDNEMHKQAKEDERRARRENALPADHCPEAFSIYR